MPKLADFNRYIKKLCQASGHQDRHAGFTDYSRGLMLPIERKSVEPLAAHTDPLHVSAKHQSLHHLVAKSEWSDRAVLACVRDWVMPERGRQSQFYWIVDDTGFPKKGEDSVGVARQYCGQMGKQDNCQVAVSLSFVASERGSVPIDWRLYLPEVWAKDPGRRKKAGVPKEVKFLTKPKISLEQIRAAKAAGVPIGVVLADAGYGNEIAFREALSDLELDYSVGVQSVTTVWLAGTGPVPAERKNTMGRPPTRWHRVPGATPFSAKGLAETLSARQWRTVVWREGTNETCVALCRGAGAGGTSGTRRTPGSTTRAMVVDRMAPRSKQNRSSIGCRHCLLTPRWSIWSRPPRCAGALNGTIRSLNKNLA